MLWVPQILIGYLYGHVLEYSIHRWILHPFGTKKGSPFAFHWAEHHKNARRQYMSDRPSGREFLWLGALMVLHLPVYFIWPWMYLILGLSCCSYYYHHTRSHADVLWGYRNLKHHVDHHMGDQHKNWGVRSDIIDRILGTRVNGTTFSSPERPAVSDH